MSLELKNLKKLLEKKVKNNSKKLTEKVRNKDA